MKLHRNNRLKPDQLAVDESVLTTQNRYLGVRANFEEGVPFQNSIRGTYLNGVYDSKTIHYGEKVFGFPEKSQTVVNMPDAQTITFEDEYGAIDMTRARVVALERYLDLARALAVRTITYETTEKHRYTFTFKRLAHLTMHPLFLIDVTVCSETYSGPLYVKSTLNGDVENVVDEKDPRAGGFEKHHLVAPRVTVDDDAVMLRMSTKTTEFDVYTTVTHNEPFTIEKTTHGAVCHQTFTMTKNTNIQFTKYVLYHHTLDYASPEKAIQEDLNEIRRLTLDELEALQLKAMHKFNKRASLHIDAPEIPDMDTIVRYNLFQLYTAGAHNPRTNIAAKGLTGEGYEGHTFWDSEIYMLPFFMQIDRTIAEAMLAYRFDQLKEAKEEAKTLGSNAGAKYPWRTINGREASAYYPAGQAQFHINADIAYAFDAYATLFKDEKFIKEQCIPLMLETARFLATHTSTHSDKSHLNHVTGPDEYTTLVDDNYYTNSMFKHHLTRLLYWCDAYPNVAAMDEAEKTRYETIIKTIVLPYDEDAKIDVQDASFMARQPWPNKALSPNERPLMLHHHPMTLQRRKVLKQPDTVLSHALLYNRPLDVMRNSLNYYETITTHDSSLSYCIHALQAARLKDLDKAYDYFVKTLRLDLDDLNRNTKDGLHLANAGGVYLALLRGFMGLTIADEVSIEPYLPKAMNRLTMTIRANTTTHVHVDVSRQGVALKSESNTTLIVYGKQHVLKAYETLSVPYQD